MIPVFGVNLTWTVALELLAAVLALIAVSMVISRLVARALAAWARRRGIPPEDAAIPLVRRYLVPVLLVGALHLALSALDLPRNLRLVVTRLLSATTLALTLYLVSQIVIALLDRAMRQTEPGRRAGRQLMTMARITLLIVSLAFLLDNLGIRVTALVTTLGVTSLAVALALQDTLSNFFAGIYLQADRPFRVGHHIQLDTGAEGTVVDIGWRSTRLLTTANNTVVVPNERLLKSILTNYDLPESQLAVAVRVTVPYGASVETVERLLLEAAQRARADVRGVLEAPAPGVRLVPGFGDQGLVFTLTVWVRNFMDQEPAQHAVRRAIVELFRAESIELRRG